VLRPWRGPAFFSGAIAVNDAPLRQVVGRQLDLHTIAWENSYTVPAQASGDVRQDDVPVIELDRKGRARKNLLDIAEYLKRGLFHILRGVGFWYACACSVLSIANGYGKRSFFIRE
jgi:hypothetical protein